MLVLGIELYPDVRALSLIAKLFWFQWLWSAVENASLNIDSTLRLI